MRTFLKILTFIWFSFCIYGSIKLSFDHPLKTDRNQVLINKRLKPAISFINQFLKKENHLPAKKEFFLWERNYYQDFSIDINDTLNTAVINYFNNDNYAPKSIKSEANIDWTKNYYLEVWNGKDFIYYSSWNKQFESADKNDKYIGILIWCLLGFFPLIFWFWDKKKQRTTLVWQKTG